MQRNYFRICILFHFLFPNNHLFSTSFLISAHFHLITNTLSRRMFSVIGLFALVIKRTQYAPSQVRGWRQPPSPFPNHFFFFFPRYITDPNLLFVRNQTLGWLMQHYECHKVSIWPGVIEYDGLSNPVLLPPLRDQYFYPAELLVPSVSLFLWPDWAKLSARWGTQLRRRAPDTPTHAECTNACV